MFANRRRFVKWFLWACLLALMVFIGDCAASMRLYSARFSYVGYVRAYHGARGVWPATSSDLLGVLKEGPRAFLAGRLKGIRVEVLSEPESNRHEVVFRFLWRHVPVSVPCETEDDHDACLKAALDFAQVEPSAEPLDLTVYRDLDALFLALLGEYGDRPLPPMSTQDGDFARFAQEELDMDPELAAAIASRTWKYLIEKDNIGKRLSEIPDDGHVIEAVHKDKVIGFVSPRGRIRVSSVELSEINERRWIYGVPRPAVGGRITALSSDDVLIECYGPPGTSYLYGSGNIEMRPE